MRMRMCFVAGERVSEAFDAPWGAYDDDRGEVSFNDFLGLPDDVSADTEYTSVRKVSSQMVPQQRENQYEYTDPLELICVAIIREAVLSLRSRDHATVCQALDWLYGTQSIGTDVVSFVEACQFLKCDPDIIRSEICKRV